MEKFVIYQIEGGGFGYKPAKVNLSEGCRICVNKEKMVFATVLKTVSATAEQMDYNWKAAKGQSKFFGTAYFKMVFLGMF